jgi:hypothetical protein
MKSLIQITILGVLIGFSAFAHEGHDHGAPSFQAPRGGILKSALDYHFELVRDKNTVQIYAYDQAGKELPTNKFKTTAELELPRQKKTGLPLVDKKTNWEATVDAKGAHRFTLKLNLEAGNEKDYVSFTVENK